MILRFNRYWFTITVILSLSLSDTTVCPQKLVLLSLKKHLWHITYLHMSLSGTNQWQYPDDKNEIRTNEESSEISVSRYIQIIFTLLLYQEIRISYIQMSSPWTPWPCRFRWCLCPEGVFHPAPGRAKGHGLSLRYQQHPQGVAELDFERKTPGGFGILSDQH